jgi:hypothetical protein
MDETPPEETPEKVPDEATPPAEAPAVAAEEAPAVAADEAPAVAAEEAPAVAAEEVPAAAAEVHASEAVAAPPVVAADISPPSPPPAPPSPAQPRRSRPLLRVLIAVGVLVALAIIYTGADLVYAQSRLSSAQSAYNSAVAHQNSLTDTVNSVTTKLTGSNVATATSTDITQEKALWTQIVQKSQDAQTQIATDDASLASGDSSLNENRWLTALRSSDIDKMSTRIGHLRKALAEAKIITADYVQLGTFEESLFDVAIDLDALSTAATNTDFAAARAAITKAQADTTKAIGLDKAPGLPAEVDGLLKDIQKLANDFSELLAAAQIGDQAVAETALTAVQADGTKIEGYDFNKIGSSIDSFYKPMLDAYNAEVDAANKT